MAIRNLGFGGFGGFGSLNRTPSLGGQPPQIPNPDFRAAPELANIQPQMTPQMGPTPTPQAGGSTGGGFGDVVMQFLSTEEGRNALSSITGLGSQPQLPLPPTSVTPNHFTPEPFQPTRPSGLGGRFRRRNEGMFGRF